MEFRRQLVIGHVALLIIFVVTGAVSAVALRIACDQLDGVARDLSADTLATQQLRRQAEQLVSTSRGYLATSDPKSLQRFDATAAGLHSEQAEFDRASGGAHRLAERAQHVVFAATALAIMLGVVLAAQSSRRLSAQYAQSRAATEAARRATAARDELVAIVSHDLRNPLATITMGAGLLQETERDPRIRKHVAAIASAAGLMQHLIDQLLDVARLEHGTLGLALERCEPGAVLDAVQALFQIRAIEAGVELSVGDAPAGGAAVTADRQRVVQVLSNLVANALKFTPRGGRIAVTGRRDGPVVRFEVADTGPGIPEDQIPHLFERYWQGRSSSRGSLGLGLYICRQLVAAHRGDIGVRTRLGDGSTFWFTLPAAT
jgi:signal transduction histidine kinase